MQLIRFVQAMMDLSLSQVGALTRGLVQAIKWT